MKRRLKQVAIAIVVVLAAAQLIRADRVNPPTDASRTLQAHVGIVGVWEMRPNDEFMAEITPCGQRGNGQTNL